MLGLVLKHNRSPSLAELRNRVPPAEYRMALIQSTDLVGAWRAFERCRGERFKRKLRDAVTGPVDPVSETPGANSRDLLFELSVGAFFRRRKDPVLVGTHKDVILKMDEEIFFAECKRPRSLPGVCRAMEDATRQIATHFESSHRKASTHLWGFVASTFPF
jgi:hypothetical protein